MRIRKGRIYSIGIKDIKNNSLNIPEGYNDIYQLYHSMGEITRILKNVNIPSNVSAIHDRAFANLRSLTGINLSKISYIGARAFYNTNLNSVNLSNLESIDYTAFENCLNLREIYINKTVKDITVFKDNVRISFSEFVKSMPNLKKLSFILNDRKDLEMALDLCETGCKIIALDGSVYKELNQELFDLIYELYLIYEDLVRQNKILQVFDKEQEFWIQNRINTLEKTRYTLYLLKSKYVNCAYMLNNSKALTLIEKINKIFDANEYLINQHKLEQTLIYNDKLYSVIKILKVYLAIAKDNSHISNSEDYIQAKKQLNDYVNAEYSRFSMLTANFNIMSEETNRLIDDINMLFIELWDLISSRSYVYST